MNDEFWLTDYVDRLNLEISELRAENGNLKRSSKNLLDRMEKFIDRRFIDDGPDREYNKLHDAMEKLRRNIKE